MMQCGGEWMKRLAVVLALAGGLCGQPGWAQVQQVQQVQIKGAGASFPSRVYERWAQRFASQHPLVALRYQPTGSGDGVRQIKARAVHLGATDNPLTAAQLAEHKLVQIPMLVGGLVPVVRLPGVASNQLVLDGQTLAELMLGEIKRWDDPRLAQLNPGLKLPALPVARIVRQDASGSTEVWARFLALSSPRFAQKVAVSQKPVWPGAPLGAQGNDGVVELLQRTPGGLSYVSFDRVQRDQLTGVRLRGAQGQPVVASEAAFRAAILASDVYRKGDDTASLLATQRADAWPLTATSYVLLDAAPRDMASAQWVARFVYWCFMHGDELTRGTGFAPLPERVQARLAGRLMRIQGPDGLAPDLAMP